jgi:CheY-like chemotaxis protein
MATTPSRRVLVVDDDDEIRLLLEALLRGAGYAVATACDGRAALRSFHTNPCDLVVLDLSMPELDGFETLERLRDLSDVPVVLLTARSSEIDKVRGFRAGAYKTRLATIAKEANKAQHDVEQGLQAKTVGELHSRLAAFAVGDQKLGDEVAALKPPKDAEQANAALAKAEHDNAAAVRALLPRVAKARTPKAAVPSSSTTLRPPGWEANSTAHSTDYKSSATHAAVDRRATRPARRSRRHICCGFPSNRQADLLTSTRMFRRNVART